MKRHACRDGPPGPIDLSAAPATWRRGVRIPADHVRGKTPERVRRELGVTLLGYTLIRKVIVTSAAIHGKPPCRLGFTLACQTVLASGMLLSTGSCSNRRAMYSTTLAHNAANEVANRPGRIEPRVLKRRRHRYPLMQRPRDPLRLELGQT